MGLHSISWSVDPDGEDVEREAAAVENLILPSSPPQGSVRRFDGYISYADMQELKGTMGDLLHRILDFYISFAVGPNRTSLN